MHFKCAYVCACTHVCVAELNYFTASSFLVATFNSYVAVVVVVVGRLVVRQRAAKHKELLK